MKCPLCNKSSFKTSQALAAHRASAHNGNGNGNGSKSPKGTKATTRSKAAPLTSAGSITRTATNTTINLSGTDFIGRVTVKSSPQTVGDRILRVIPISPSAYPGIRLTRMAALFERYRFKKLNLRFVSALPKTMAGQLVLYIDTDPTDDPTTLPDADTLIQQAVSHGGAKQWNVHEGVSVPLLIRKDDQFYYTGETKANERFNFQGKAFLIQVTDAVDFNGSAIAGDIEAGMLYFDWTVDFQSPQIDDPAIEITPLEFTNPDSATESFFEVTVSGGPAIIIGASVNASNAGAVSLAALTLIGVQDTVAGASHTTTSSLRASRGKYSGTVDAGINEFKFVATHAPGVTVTITST